jgi:hypothetical protein
MRAIDVILIVFNLVILVANLILLRRDIAIKRELGKKQDAIPEINPVYPVVSAQHKNSTPSTEPKIGKAGPSV